eukprot:gnl/TRDRNA2_/TRDRNA2_130871_c0_seq1.p1 gnl/TRDRNA2_/TRDRNA2_130871_c0~~gnl/TRDRNA2_/TRDRNA2_130871_c0_seq1.p1  ORF type:complete len:560 (-),score=115.92 gnl/TRDRNA2_/TRDRNA2_130871_c0_seq1:78-1757(-)
MHKEAVSSIMTIPPPPPQFAGSDLLAAAAVPKKRLEPSQPIAPRDEQPSRPIAPRDEQPSRPIAPRDEQPSQPIAPRDEQLPAPEMMVAPIVPQLQLPTLPATEAVQSGEAAAEIYLDKDSQDEIDRLVTKHLEGSFSARAHQQPNISKMAGYLDTWHGQLENAAYNAILGLSQIQNVFLEHLGVSDKPCAGCTRAVRKAVPQVVFEDNEDGWDVAEKWSKAPPTEQSIWRSRPVTLEDEHFQDLIATPVAAMSLDHVEGAGKAVTPLCEADDVLHPLPGEKAKLPLAGESTPAKPLKSVNKSSSASALSVSTAMTSSAASLLGGFTQQSKEVKTHESRDAKTAIHVEPKTVVGGESKNSGAGAMRQSEDAKTLDSRDARTSNKVDSKTVIGGESRTSLVAPGGPSLKKNQSKSVIAGNVSMTSNAASALGALTSDGRIARDRGDARKSVIAGNTQMNSAAAASLVGLSDTHAKKRSSSSDHRSSVGTASVVRERGEDAGADLATASAANTSSTKHSGRTDAKSSVGGVRRSKAGGSVISGLGNTNSQSSALLGALVQK